MGATAPNPPVGAAALNEHGEILALAAHRKAGEDHAEAALLKICRERGITHALHTVCVTLEPCNHHGRTPPCSEALIAAGVKRVVIGAKDPNPNVKGGGAKRLRQAGIDVIENVENDACKRLIHAFAFSALYKKPFITVKRALDTKGSMVPPQGQKTFTSKESLVLAHRLRKKADAIITGSGTILADNPLFTVRHTTDDRRTNRILAILDRRKRVPTPYIALAESRGFDVSVYDDIDSCVADLASRDVLDVLVEAGSSLSDSILESDNWAMRVDIQTNGSNKDDVRIEFNKSIAMPFDTSASDTEPFLP